MNRYNLLILLAFLNHYFLFPACREMWTRWKQKRQAQQEKKWHEEDKILDEQERRELYRQATRHADRVYVLKKWK